MSETETIPGSTTSVCKYADGQNTLDLDEVNSIYWIVLRLVYPTIDLLLFLLLNFYHRHCYYF